MYENKIELSLATLSVMATVVLCEIKDSNEYSEKTKSLAVRVLNTRQC